MNKVYGTEIGMERVDDDTIAITQNGQPVLHLTNQAFTQLVVNSAAIMTPEIAQEMVMHSMQQMQALFKSD